MHSFNRYPEFFYPNVFIKIKEAISQTPTTTNKSSVVFHGTHLDEVLDICQGTNAIFKGNLKQWRLLDDECYNEEYCSYLVTPGKPPVPMTPTNCTPFGPFVWFGTKRDETDKYGPCQFEFNFTSVLRGYKTCRNTQEICYRAAGTLVYKQEVCHIVMVCCKEDKECRSYPLITNNNTCYFTPPNSASDNNSVPADSQFQTKINDYQRRHEHVTFALFLPNNRKLYLSYRDGRMKLTPHNTYCIASRSRECLFKEDQLLISIDQLKIITKWISDAGKEEEETNEPVVKYNPLDQSLEDSFDWLSSADETEYYSNEGDRHDFDNYDELNFDDFSNDYDFTSDSTVTTSNDLSTSSSDELEEYY